MLSNIVLEHQRVGVYYVGNMAFISKSDALIYATATKQKVHWDFNDEVFSSINWKIPITTPLEELYKQRAQQLRDKYDYLSLFFSGGVDSTNVLHSFIDNDIFLDEIVMYRPARTIGMSNTLDKSAKNVYSEIDFAAIPHLKKYLKDTRTLVRFIDMDDSAEQFFSDENLVSEFCTLNNMGVTPVVKTAMCLTDKIWNDLYDAGKTVAHIHGIDKPIISYENGEYSFSFEDSMSFNFESKSFTEKYERITKHQFHEYFYWTPDLPQLVIKQCQVVKQICDNDFIFKMLFVRSLDSMQEKFMPIIHYIYPQHVNEIRNLFTTNKASLGLLGGQHAWFHTSMSKTINGQFNDMVKYTQNSIDDNFFMNANSVFAGEDAHTKKSSEKTAIRLFKSKKYFL